jgi:predicted CXXCH cytochrome family protein
LEKRELKAVSAAIVVPFLKGVIYLTSGSLMPILMLNFRSCSMAMLVVVGVVALPLASLAAILGSKHDLSTGVAAANNYNFAHTNNNHVCVYCHTPHDPNTNNGGRLLWDRSFSTATYALYSSPGAEPMHSQPTASSSYSVLCLSCHDGTIAVDSLAKMQGALLGGELSNDHPVGVTYDNIVNPALNPENSITAAGLKLYEGKVECATCHDPHNNNNSAFTRIANTQSGLCTTCHLK